MSPDLGPARRPKPPPHPFTLTQRRGTTDRWTPPISRSCTPFPLLSPMPIDAACSAPPPHAPAPTPRVAPAPRQNRGTAEPSPADTTPQLVP
ncbi:hypothetical protein PVAP13_8KG234703 [Panicum virgatum]|uniref:Uncharacterized protein n=1 Tax=Panicum virgatum TaxID=38727 RepID=A0A8T0PQ98_PANVG|nr:hypothetical protein PVAP13_8KG234703 [Panicum virgatum]